MKAVAVTFVVTFLGVMAALYAKQAIDKRRGA